MTSLQLKIQSQPQSGFILQNRLTILKTADLRQQTMPTTSGLQGEIIDARPISETSCSRVLVYVILVPSCQFCRECLEAETVCIARILEKWSGLYNQAFVRFHGVQKHSM